MEFLKPPPPSRAGGRANRFPTRDFLCKVGPWREGEGGWVPRVSPWPRGLVPHWFGHFLVFFFCCGPPKILPRTDTQKLSTPGGEVGVPPVWVRETLPIRKKSLFPTHPKRQPTTCSSSAFRGCKGQHCSLLYKIKPDLLHEECEGANQ